MKLYVDNQVYGFIILLYSQQLLTQLYFSDKDSEWVKIEPVIKELHDAWRFAGQEKSEAIEEEARQLPASVSVRSCWVEVGSKMDAFEYRIEMSGGGPAVSIYGTLDSLGYPIEPEVKHQDWFTPWEYSHNKTSSGEDATEAIEWFVSLFNFEV